MTNTPEPKPIQTISEAFAVLNEWVGFSSSVIKSGEDWTQTCQRMQNRANLAIRFLYDHAVR